MKSNPNRTIIEARSRILNAGTKVFSDKGFERVGIREIAAYADVNSSLISFYFGSKEGLYRAVLDTAGRLINRMVESLPELPEGRDPEVRPKATLALRAFVETFFRVGLEPLAGQRRDESRILRQALLRLVVRDLFRTPAGVENALLETTRMPVAYLDRCIRALRPDLDEDAALRMAVSIHGQMLFQIGCSGFLAKVRHASFTKDDLGPLIDHVLHFSLQGIQKDVQESAGWTEALVDLDLLEH